MDENIKEAGSIKCQLCGVEFQKITNTHLKRAHPDWTLERSVFERRAAGRFRLVETRFGHDMHDKTALITVLGRRHASDDFKRLHCVG